MSACLYPPSQTQSYLNYEDNEEALIKRTEKFLPNFMAFSVIKEILVLDKVFSASVIVILNVCYTH